LQLLLSRLRRHSSSPFVLGFRFIATKAQCGMLEPDSPVFRDLVYSRSAVLELQILRCSSLLHRQPPLSLSTSANTMAPSSGIFGYINYLVEKDRKFILNTLINGMLAYTNAHLPSKHFADPSLVQACPVSSTEDTTLPVWPLMVTRRRMCLPSRRLARLPS